MKHSKREDLRASQMDPCPTVDDLEPRPILPGHGISGSYYGSRRGILVSMKKLKRAGVTLSKGDRAKTEPIVGELIIERVHDRSVDFQMRAEIMVLKEYNFPSIQASLCNPMIFSVNERGMILHGIEKAQVEGGGFASYQQVWLVLFGKVEPGREPPF